MTGTSMALCLILQATMFLIHEIGSSPLPGSYLYTQKDLMTLGFGLHPTDKTSPVADDIYPFALQQKSSDRPRANQALHESGIEETLKKYSLFTDEGSNFPAPLTSGNMEDKSLKSSLAQGSTGGGRGRGGSEGGRGRTGGRRGGGNDGGSVGQRRGGEE